MQVGCATDENAPASAWKSAMRQAVTCWTRTSKVTTKDTQANNRESRIENLGRQHTLANKTAV